MGMGGLLLAVSSVSAVSQYSAGNVAQAEANYNATVAESEASLIGAQAEIEFGQYQKLKGEYLGESFANMAASGIMPQGSSLAATIKAQRNIALDQVYGQFDYATRQSAVRSQADTYRRQGKIARSSARTNAYSTLLQGGASYAMYKGYGTKPQSSFDTDGGAKKAYGP